MARKNREQRIEYWAEKAQPLVASCASCQPSDADEDTWVGGDRTDVGWLLHGLGVPEDLYEDVATRLTCGNCGQGELGIYHEIGRRDAEELAHEQRWRTWKNKYAKPVGEFGGFLGLYPYLGVAHSIGRKIRRMIVQYPKTSIPPSSWWRARPADGARRFDVSDMLAPPRSRPIPEGRFNHYGQRVFYVASEQETALAEALDLEKNEALAWVQEFQLPAVERVLDLVRPEWDEEGQIPLLALGLISHMDQLSPQHSATWKPEYFVPRYIADCAKEVGFEAIRFRSARAYGVNLVLFDWDERLVMPVGEPRSRTYLPVDPGF